MMHPIPVCRIVCGIQRAYRHTVGDRAAFLAVIVTIKRKGRMSIPPTKIPISITGLVYRNSAKPGSHRAFSSERIDSTIGLDECILHDIFSVCMVSENAVGGEMQGVSVRSETLV